MERGVALPTTPRLGVSVPSPASAAEAAERLIVALDLPDAERARALAKRLEGRVGLVKVGLELFCAAGPRIVRDLREDGHDVFLDLKLADIPATVAGAARSIRALEPRFLTVNAPPSSVRAACEALAGSATRVLGITVLTSVDDAELGAWCATGETVAEVVRRRATMLLEAGCDGLVCSPREVGVLRAALPDTILVTPGVRPEGTATHDQARAATPAAAFEAGADYLVVGRPIRDAEDPAAAAAAIAEEGAGASQLG